MTRALPTTLALAATLALAGCDFLRGYAEGHSSSLAPFETEELPSAQLGAARFLFDDFGALNTDTLESQAVPLKLASAALVVQQYPDQPATQANLRAVLTRFGFIFPQTVVNWPLLQQPEFRTPLGIVSGMVQRDLPRVSIEVANLSCASCHAGVTYDAQGQPQPLVWLGLPNTSLDLDAYADGVFGALRAGFARQERVFAAIRELFPDVSEDELKSLRKSVWPKLVERLQAGDRVPPVRNGGPGRSNSVETLKFQFHLKPGGLRSAAGVSIPQIGDQVLRWSLLADGLYTRRGDPRFEARSSDAAATPVRSAEMVAFFSMPALGLHPEEARDTHEPISEVLTFMSRYESPKYPGVIDDEAARRGAVVYARCVECHGEYVEHEGRLRLRGFPNRLSPLAEIGTDAARLDAVNDEVINAIETSSMGKLIHPARTRGYVAPSLAGIWATAPYLHNGSVPTLAALMMPAERPAKFRVGGHRLDFRKVGIAGQVNADGEYVYPPNYLPWSTPALFDTSRPGQSNKGHEREFDGLSAEDKSDLIEFLKQL